MNHHKSTLDTGEIDRSHRTKTICLLSLIACTALGLPHARGEDPSDKSSYHLFRPTPEHLMRELSTDRPDLTESPYTVDAGHIQMEMDVVNATFDRDQSGGGDVRNRSRTFGGMNFKVGLLNQVDLQMILLFDRTTFAPSYIGHCTGLTKVQVKSKYLGRKHQAK